MPEDQVIVPDGLQVLLSTVAIRIAEDYISGRLPSPVDERSFRYYQREQTRQFVESLRERLLVEDTSPEATLFDQEL